MTIALFLPRRIFLSLLTIALTLLVASCQKGDDTSSGGGEKKPLIVGMEMTYPPFETKDNQGNPSGVSVDLAYALGQHLGRKVEIKDMGFEALQTALPAGRIDVIISSMTITDERKKTLDFSDPYVHTALALLVTKDSPIESIADVDKPGLVVVSKLATTGALYASSLRQAKVTILDSAVDCVERVSSGRADVFIYDQMSIYDNWQSRQDTTRALLDPFQKESWGIAVKKGNTALLTQVNEFLAKYRKEGGFDQLAKKHLGPQMEAFEKMGTTLVF